MLYNALLLEKVKFHFSRENFEQMSDKWLKSNDFIVVVSIMKTIFLTFRVQCNLFIVLLSLMALRGIDKNVLDDEAWRHVFRVIGPMFH